MIFVQDQYCYLAEQLKHVERFEISQFANQEFTLQLFARVEGQRCVVLGSLTASADQQLQLLLLLHTLRSACAQQVVLFSPYLGYQRQDKIINNHLRGLQWADAMLHAAGVSQIITIEPHAPQLLSSLQVPVTALSAANIFEQEMAHFVAAGFGFIFPDAGAAARYSWIAEKFPTTMYGAFVKNRAHGVVNINVFEGKVGRKAIVYDDILDSGATLLQVCIALRQMHVEEIVIFVTHAFFHGYAWDGLWNCGVQAVYCTNSLPHADQINHPKIHIKSIVEFLKKSI